MKLLQLRYFQTVCKYSNITRAAKELHISQPSLSASIHELEDEFGLTLFHRSSRGMLLTEDGEQFLKEASDLLSRADDFSSRMRALGNARGSVTLGVPPMLGTLVFPEFLRALREEYPELRIQLQEHGSISNRALVQDGSLDMAIISSLTPLPAELDSCRLGTLGICLYVSRCLPLDFSSGVTAGKLTGMPLAILGEDTFLTDFVRRHLKEDGITCSEFIQTNQLSTIQRLVENGTAAAFLFDGVLENSENLIKIPLAGSPAVDVRLIWKKSRAMSAGIRKVIQAAGRRYPSDGQCFIS